MLKLQICAYISYKTGYGKRWFEAFFLWIRCSISSLLCEGCVWDSGHRRILNNSWVDLVTWPLNTCNLITISTATPALHAAMEAVIRIQTRDRKMCFCSRSAFRLVSLSIFTITESCISFGNGPASCFILFWSMRCTSKAFILDMVWSRLITTKCSVPATKKLNLNKSSLDSSTPRLFIYFNPKTGSVSVSWNIKLTEQTEFCRLHHVLI